MGIPVPKRLSPTKRAMQDKRFYFQYHREYGNDTDDCRELRRAIEQLIQNGKLGRFTNTLCKHRYSKNENGNKSKTKKSQNEVVGVINIIVGGEVPKEKRMKRIQKEES